MTSATATGRAILVEAVKDDTICEAVGKACAGMNAAQDCGGLWMREAKALLAAIRRAARKQEESNRAE